MIRLGILDFDTSHVIEFTTRMNHKHKDKEQWVDGVEVVIGCPGESKIMPDAFPVTKCRWKSSASNSLTNRKT